MKVTSPIGELPFTVRSVSLEGRHMVVEGELGTWKSRIEVGAEDLPMLARAFRGPLAAAALGDVALAFVRRLCRCWSASTRAPPAPAPSPSTRAFGHSPRAT